MKLRKYRVLQASPVLQDCSSWENHHRGKNSHFYWSPACKYSWQGIAELMSATFRLALRPLGITRMKKKRKKKKKTKQMPMSWILGWNLLPMFKKYKQHLLPCIAGSSNRNFTCQIEYMPLNLSSLRSGTQCVTKTWEKKKKKKH